MKSFFEYLFLRKRVILLLTIACLALLSLVAQGFTLYQLHRLESQLHTLKEHAFTTSSTSQPIVTSPYGTRSEIRSVFKDGVWQTETQATPITEEEVRATEEAWKKRQETLRASWEEQDRLFQNMRRQLFW
jgi:hypothetical protein